MARRRLEGLPRRVADEEDVALSAMKSFYRGVEAGRFPQLDDRDDLWRLLVTITARKAVSQARSVRAQKRGGGRIRGESVFATGLDGMLGAQPTPELAAMVADNCTRLLDGLQDEIGRWLAGIGA